MAWSSSKTEVFTQGDAPSLPAAKGTFNDPVFGTQIIRVTDNSFPAAGSWTHAYSYWPAFNANNTKLLLPNDSNGVIIDFDPETLTVGSAIFPASSSSVGSYVMSGWTTICDTIENFEHGLFVSIRTGSTSTSATLASVRTGEDPALDGVFNLIAE